MIPGVAAALLLAAAQPISVTSSRIPYRPPPPACVVLPAVEGADLMVADVYSGKTLSNAWVGDPNEVTYVVPFHLAPGGPVHLIVTGYAQNIYQFSGAVDRIRRLTVMGHRPAAVAGLPRVPVEFSPACLPHGLFRMANGTGAETVLRHFGQLPDSIVYEYSPYRIRIDGRLEVDPPPSPPPGSGENETDRLYQYSPGGVADLDPEELVSAAPVGSYHTLPQEAGIRQLVRAGVLVRATEADVRRWQARARRRGDTGETAHGAWLRNAYRATRPAVVPSGLCGTHSVEFFLPTADYLTGNPCHSTFYLADGTKRGPQ